VPVELDQLVKQRAGQRPAARPAQYVTRVVVHLAPIARTVPSVAPPRRRRRRGRGGRGCRDPAEFLARLLGDLSTGGRADQHGSSLRDCATAPGAMHQGNRTRTDLLIRVGDVLVIGDRTRAQIDSVQNVRALPHRTRGRQLENERGTGDLHGDACRPTGVRCACSGRRVAPLWSMFGARARGAAYWLSATGRAGWAARSGVRPGRRASDACFQPVQVTGAAWSVDPSGRAGGVGVLRPAAVAEGDGHRVPERRDQFRSSRRNGSHHAAHVARHGTDVAFCSDRRPAPRRHRPAEAHGCVGVRRGVLEP